MGLVYTLLKTHVALKSFLWDATLVHVYKEEQKYFNVNKIHQKFEDDAISILSFQYFS